MQFMHRLTFEIHYFILLSSCTFTLPRTCTEDVASNGDGKYATKKAKLCETVFQILIRTNVLYWSACFPLQKEVTIAMTQWCIFPYMRRKLYVRIFCTNKLGRFLFQSFWMEEFITHISSTHRWYLCQICCYQYGELWHAHLCTKYLLQSPLINGQTWH